MPGWGWAWPLVACAVSAAWFAGVAGGAPTAAALIAAVCAAVSHAEVVPHRVGEPFGTLVLAPAVTVIEVALIVSVGGGDGPDKAGLARGTVFAAVMMPVPLAAVVGLAKAPTPASGAGVA